MNIGDEAVDAAAIRLWGRHRKDDKTLRRLTFVALRAAAPHMLAEAWEEGLDYSRRESCTEEANPYRTTT